MEQTKSARALLIINAFFETIMSPVKKYALRLQEHKKEGLKTSLLKAYLSKYQTNQEIKSLLRNVILWLFIYLFIV